MRKDFLSFKDLNKEELFNLFSLTETLKKARPNQDNLLQGKTFVLVFEKPSLRTRVTFETGIFELGGKPIYLSPQDIGMGTRESVKDVALNLSRWVHGIIARVFAHQNVVELAKHANIPVINALSDLEHPCQVLADLFTVRERFGKFTGLKLAYIGDGNNVCHSLMLGAKLCGLEMWVATPKDYEPNNEYQKMSAAKITNDPAEAARDADIVYTDVWASMGQELEKEERLKIFSPYQINSKLMNYAKSSCLVMHCLPAHRGEEITDEVIDSPTSIVFDQSENRLHTQKAVLSTLTT